MRPADRKSILKLSLSECDMIGHVQIPSGEEHEANSDPAGDVTCCGRSPHGGEKIASGRPKVEVESGVLNGLSFDPPVVCSEKLRCRL